MASWAEVHFECFDSVSLPVCVADSRALSQVYRERQCNLLFGCEPSKESSSLWEDVFFYKSLKLLDFWMILFLPNASAWKFCSSSPSHLKIPLKPLRTKLVCWLDSNYIFVQSQLRARAESLKPNDAIHDSSERAALDKVSSCWVLITNAKRQAQLFSLSKLFFDECTR